MNKSIVQCKHCGWQHFAVTRKYAGDEVESFNEYYDTLTIDEQNKYYGGQKSIINNYENCDRCGKLADMVAPTKELIGSTVGPIIWETP